MVLPALERGGYEYFRQVDIGERLGGGKHIVDLVAYDEAGKGYLVSMKWQQTSGHGGAEGAVRGDVPDPGRARRAGALRARPQHRRAEGKPEHRPAAIDGVGMHADFIRPRQVFANDRVEVGDADFRPARPPPRLLEEHERR